MLLSLVGLLAFLIAFLDVSVVVLLQNDKTAQIFQVQESRVEVAGKVVTHLIRRTEVSLQRALAMIQEEGKVVADLRNVVEHEPEFLFLSVHRLNLKTMSWASTLEARSKNLSVNSLASLDLTSEKLKTVIPDLLKNSISLINASPDPSNPRLGLLVADPLQQNDPRGMPVAYGVVSLGEIARIVAHSNVAIATTQGLLLFESPSASSVPSEQSSVGPLLQAAVKSGGKRTGTLDYKVDGTAFIGSYYAPDARLLALTYEDKSSALSTSYQLAAKFVLLGILAILVIVVLARQFSKILTDPINRLYHATLQLTEGNFEQELQVTGQDEIAVLTRSFNDMSKRISELMKDAVDKVYLENQLSIASTIQHTLIPAKKFQNDKVVMRSHYQSAAETGGDWWGFFTTPTKMCVMVADATGHGFLSALVTATNHSCFSVMQKMGQEDPSFSFSPAMMLAFANRAIYDSTKGQTMMTAFLGVIDYEKKIIRFASAGHNPPWLFRKNGEKWAASSLVAEGQRLGDARDAPPFEEKELPFGEDDILFLYTDGLTEGKNKSGDMYSKKRARKMVESLLNAGPDKLITGLMSDFFKHNEGKVIDDDITTVAAQLLPTAPPVQPPPHPPTTAAHT